MRAEKCKASIESLNPQLAHSLTHPVVGEIVQNQSRAEGASRIDAAACIADLKSARKTLDERTFLTT